MKGFPSLTYFIHCSHSDGSQKESVVVVVVPFGYIVVVDYAPCPSRVTAALTGSTSTLDDVQRTSRNAALQYE